MILVDIDQMKIGEYYQIYLAYPPLGVEYPPNDSTEKEVRFIMYDGRLGQLDYGFIRECIVAIYELSDDEVATNIVLPNI